MAYRLKVGDYYFEENEILAIPEVNRVDIIGDELSIDEANPVVLYVKYDAQLYAPRGYDGILSSDGMVFATSKSYTSKDFATLERGTKVEIIQDGTTVSTYFLDEITRQTINTYEISCMSGIGLLDTKYHTGGMYIMSDAVRFVDMIAELVSGTVGELSQGLYPITDGVFDCYVEQVLGSQIVTGHLPYDTARENLHKLMLAYGASITRDTNGTIIFCYLYNNESPEEISADDTYDSGKVVNNQPATLVQVKEHAFLNKGTDDELQTVFDSTVEGAADNTLILFDDPLHNLTALNGLTINESNCNYAIVTGSGQLNGYKYTHSTKLVTRGSSVAKDNVVSIDDAELINPLNSSNVVERMYSYYTTAKEVDVDFVLKGQRVGRQYLFTDAFGTERKGFITEMEITPSATKKASATIITDYIPSAQGNAYNNAEVLTGSGTWTVKAEKFKAILIGGGAGVDGAYNGSSGGAGSCVYSHDTGYYTFTGASGGAGGKGSKASNGGKVYEVEFTSQTVGDEITFSCGAGGAGGANNGGSGSLGGDTAFGDYSSASGSVSASGVINLLTGDVYAAAGAKDGIDGGDGGDSDYHIIHYVTMNDYFHNGDDVAVDNITYSGGSPHQWSESYYYGIGGSGGGAAYGENGGDAWGAGNAGGGGSGASATSFNATTRYGCGQSGANGGAGGGAGGWRAATNQVTRPTAGGSGGSASTALSGVEGCIIIYY